MPRGGRARFAAATLCVALAVATAGPASARVVRSRRVASGVRYTEIKRSHPRQRIHVISSRLAAPSRIRIALGTGRLEGFERTSSMARRRRAIAAINGDYGRPSGRPVMTFARAGRIDQTALSWGRNFAVDHREERAFIGHPKEIVNAYVPSTSSGFRVARVNYGKPRGHEIAMYTPSGGRLVKPPNRACAVRMYPAGAMSLGPDGLGVHRSYEVQRVKCEWPRMYTKGGIVLAARRDSWRATRLSSLAVGQKIGLSWSVGWPGVVETVGGNPTLLERGRVVVGRSSHPFYRRNPRTGIGTTPGGRILLVAVDGRRPKYSKGISLRGFARLLRSLGARWALNLDGGGSTTMVVKGRVVNRPSDGHERAVSSSVLLLPRRAAPVVKLAASSERRRTWSRIVEDPASTGGFVSSLERRGGFLDPSLRRAARAFARR